MFTKNEIEQKLSSYGDFLLQRSMIASGKEQYFVSWIRGYFQSESIFKGRTWEEKLPQYLKNSLLNPIFSLGRWIRQSRL